MMHIKVNRDLTLKAISNKAKGEHNATFSSRPKAAKAGGGLFIGLGSLIQR